MKRKISLIIIISIILVCIILIYLLVIPNIFNFDFFSSKDEYNQIRKKIEDMQILPNNLELISETTGTLTELGINDNSYKYYFYIDKNKYNSYKNYWLEDVDKSLLTEAFNKELRHYGDYEFKALSIKAKEYTTDTNYKNITIKKDTKCYFVDIYNQALYYNYIFDFKDYNNYGIGEEFDIKNNSLIYEYIIYKDAGQWIIEKVEI